MIFLLGAKGFLGKAISLKLNKMSIKHVCITRKNYKKFVGKKCDILINSSTNSKKFLAEKNFDYDFKETVQNVYKSIKDFKFKKYILISSSDVYNQTNKLSYTKETSRIDVSSLSNYAFNKYLAECLVKKKSNSWIIFRCGGLIGDGLKKNPIFDLINKKKLYINPESQFQFISTITVAKIILIILKKNIDNQTFNLSGRGSIKIKKIIKKYNFKPIYAENLKYVNYNINTQKINKIININKSEKYLYEFLNESV